MASVLAACATTFGTSSALAAPTLYLSNTSGPLIQTTLDGSNSSNDLPITGDWDGDGDDNLGLYNSSGGGPAEYRLMRYNVPSSNLVENGRGGNPGDTLIAGRWYAGQTKDTVALWRDRFTPDWKLYVPTSASSGLGSGVPIGGNWHEDLPVFGDWNGDGIDTIGLWRDGVNHERDLYISNSNTNISYTLAADGAGNPGDQPVIADWDGDGKDSLALFRPSTGEWFIPNSAGHYGAGVSYGGPGDIPIAGDWDNNGSETLGVYRPSNRYFFPSPNNTSPNVNDQFQLTKLSLQDSDKLIYADWDGDGKDTPGAFRPSTGTVYYGNDAKDPTHNVLLTGISSSDNVVAGRWNSATDRDRIATWNQNSWTFTFPNYQANDIQTRPIGGNPTEDTPVFGDWNGDGVDTIGLWRRTTRSFYPSNSNTNISYPTTPMMYGVGNPGDIPIVGDWDHDGKDTIALFREMPYSGQEFYGANPTNDFAIKTSFGDPGDKPAAGDWDGDGFDTIGVSRTPPAPITPEPGPVVTPAKTFLPAGYSCQAPSQWNVGSILGLSLAPRANVIAYNPVLFKTFQSVMQCLRDVSGGRAPGIRWMVPIDALYTNASDPIDGPAAIAGFAKLVKDNPGAPIVVSIMGHDLKDDCNTVALTRVSPATKLDSCQVPNAQYFGELFGPLAARLQSDTGRTDIKYTAWNEPDLGKPFKLRQLPANVGPYNSQPNHAAWRAGTYSQKIMEYFNNDATRVIGADFRASQFTTALRDAFNAGAGSVATQWATHPYSDMSYAPSAYPTRTAFKFTDQVSARTIPTGLQTPKPLWLTEIGTLLGKQPALSENPPNAAQQYELGGLLRNRVGNPAGPTTRAFLYHLSSQLAHPPVAPSYSQDSGLTDDDGQARPALCALANVPQAACQGDATNKGSATIGEQG